MLTIQPLKAFILATLLASPAAFAEVTKKELDNIRATIDGSYDVLGTLLYCNELELYSSYLSSLQGAAYSYPNTDPKKVSAYLRLIEKNAQDEAERMMPGQDQQIKKQICETITRTAKRESRLFDEFVIKL